MKAFKRLGSFWRNMRIQTKLTVCIVSAVAVPMAILIIAFTGRLYNMVIADTIRDEQNASSTIAPQIEEKTDMIAGYMSNIIAQPFYQEWFFGGLSTTPDEMANSDNAKEFCRYINSIEENTLINEVRIYLSIPVEYSFYDNEYVKDIFVREAEVTNTYWNGIFAGTNYAVLYCPEFYLSREEIDNYGDSAYILRTSVYYLGKAYPAYVALYYDSDIYRTILDNATTTAGSVSYIINERDALVVTTDEALSGTYRVSYSNIVDSLLASNSFIEREIAGVPVYVAFYSIADTDWFMVNVIPKAPLIMNANMFMLRFALIALVCLIAAVFLAVFISKSVTNRIAKVAAQMSKVHDGPPVAMEPSTYRDEVGDLVDSYNYMTGEMNELIREKEETAEELRAAEYNALQAQINPHFLYNTMDMINWMAKQGRNEEVSEVVQNLSKFYKLTLSRKKDHSTIADELEHAQVYLELQNMRFGDAIELVLDVPDELTQYRLPKLTLQPILENAILHGILETEEKTGTIVITAWSEDDDVRILISDDGAGMTEEVRSQILSEERIRPTNSKGTNVAVVNTHRRLQILYGEKYGLSYKSAPGEGCEVSILIPKEI